MTEYEYEPVPGLPEQLPPGETLLWQGAPRWQSLARYAFHTRAVALYFFALIVLQLGWKLQAGARLGEALAVAVWLAFLAAAAVGLLVLLARGMSRTTLYTITDRRVVLRFGIALPIAINVPFNLITTAGLRLRADGSGDIPLALSGPVRAGYFILWPNARPWHFFPPQPMLRGVPEAATVAKTLAGALAARHPATPPTDPDDEADAPPRITVTASTNAITPAVGATPQ